MGIRQTIARLLNIRAFPITALKSFVGLADTGELDYYTRWIFAAIDKTASSLSAIEWRLYQNKGKKVVELQGHELLNTLYQFNPRFTRLDSVYLTFMFLRYYGEVLWYLVRDNPNAKPKEIWVLSPKSMTVSKRDEQGYPLEYKYHYGAKSMPIPAANILMIYIPKPSNMLQGMGTVDAVRDTAETDLRMTKWNKNLIANSARPDGAIEVEGALSKAQADLLRLNFEQHYAGFANAGRTAILTNGAKFNPFTIPPKDLEWVRGRELNRDEILAIFGVPKILLGMEGEYNRATAETAERVFSKYTLDPLLRRLIEQLNEFLVPMYGNDLWLDYTPLATEDKELKLQYFEKGHNKWLTTNDIRTEQGLPPMRGGDTIYQPIGMVPSMIPAGDQKTAKHVELKAEDQEIETEREVKGLKAETIARRIAIRNYRTTEIANKISSGIYEKMEKKMRTAKKGLTVRVEKKGVDISPEKKKEIHETFTALAKSSSQSFEKKIKDIIEGQAREIIANLEAQKARKKKIDPKKAMFDKEDAVKQTIAVIEPEYYNNLREGAELAGKITDIAPPDITTIPEVQIWAKNIAEKYSSDITDTSYDLFLSELKDGLAEGEGVQALAERINEFYPAMSESRSVTIAQTESARALTAGQAWAFDEMGFKEMEWSTEGPDPCDQCIDLAEQSWTVEEAKKGTVNYSHPHCFCLFLPK